MTRLVRLGGAGLLSLLTVAFLPVAPGFAQPARIADEVALVAESPHPYPTSLGGTPSWTTTVDHAGASYISVHFERFELGPGDRVVVRTPDGGRQHVYTGRGKADLGTFWTAPIPGDTAVVELMSPGAAPGGWGVAIDKFAAGYPEAEQSSAGTESICTTNDKNNAICFNDGNPTPPDDLQIYDQSRAVARMTIVGAYACTAWLVGCEGHLFTNNHCVDDPAFGVTPEVAAATADYEFMAEAPTCGPVCNGCAGTVWPGAATLEDRDLWLDYALIRLTGNPQLTYGSFSLANRQPVLDERIWIPQHAGGRAKEIAVYSTASQDASGFCEVFSNNEPACTSYDTDVGYYCDTEGGSSGSPLVATSDDKVVALHHCAQCPNRAVRVPDLVAAFGGVEGMPACSIFDTSAHPTYASHAVDDSYGNNDGIIDPGEPILLLTTLKNLGAITSTGITATLSTGTPGVTVIVPSASFPNAPAAALSASSFPHFGVQVDTSVPCGTAIDFNLTINTNQGVFVSGFRHIVGQPTPGGPVSYDSTDTPAPIFDLTTTISTRNVPNPALISDLNVSVNISHTWRGDLILDLFAPDGTGVRLKDYNGNDSADNVITTYDTLTPPVNGSMDDFNGRSLAGGWQLFVTDVFTGDEGDINSWTILANEVAHACSAVTVAAGAISANSLLVNPSLTPGNLDLSWGPSCNPVDLDYEVYQGTLGSFSSHTQVTCSTGGATSWQLTPPAGNAYYLVVPRTLTAEGSYGKSSSGVERGQGASACMTQSLAACP